MQLVPIPSWNAQGLIPPINETDPAGVERSPYAVSLLELIMNYSTSPERTKILQGLLKFRSHLHQLGLRQGFQWLDGSFLENIEALQQRPPRDIDVVTFLLAEPETEPDLEQPVFYQDWAKSEYSVDSYFVEAFALPPEQLVSWSTYWYSMWSHRRNQAWKGYLQIDLDPREDAAACDYLLTEVSV